MPRGTIREHKKFLKHYEFIGALKKRFSIFNGGVRFKSPNLKFAKLYSPMSKPPKLLNKVIGLGN